MESEAIKSQKTPHLIESYPHKPHHFFTKKVWFMLFIFISIAVFAIIYSVIYMPLIKNVDKITGTSSSMPIACTEEAKICPDGSSVGRSGPNCEFAKCPTSN